MGEVKRKIKNIIRNFIFSSGIKNTAICKKLLDKRHAGIEKERSNLFKEHANETLAVINKVLGSKNIEFWLDYGTLLGAIRENDFIAHDIDLDFGVAYSKEAINAIETAFKENDILKYREFTYDGNIVEQTYSYKGLCFDIFYYFYDEKKMWCYGFTYENSKLEKITYGDKDVSRGFEGMRYLAEKRGVEKYQFKGAEYFVPENPHGYLIENYGANYMTPIKEWDYVEAAKNQEKLPKNSDITMIEYFN